jgi:hypothetical protein
MTLYLRLKPRNPSGLLHNLLLTQGERKMVGLFMDLEFVFSGMRARSIVEGDRISLDNLLDFPPSEQSSVLDMIGEPLPIAEIVSVSGYIVRTGIIWIDDDMQFARLCAWFRGELGAESLYA